METHIPKMTIKTTQKFRPTWFTAEIRANIRKKNKLYRKYLVTKRATDYQAYKSLRNWCTKQLKKAKKLMKKYLKKLEA